MAAPIPYVLLPGTAREALARYADIFGGQTVVETYADQSRPGPPDAVAHAMLRGPVTMYVADADSDDRPVRADGLMFALLGQADAETSHRWFEALADGGKVIDPLQQRPWGAWDGIVRDHYGLSWLIGYEAA